MSTEPTPQNKTLYALYGPSGVMRGVFFTPLAAWLDSLEFFGEIPDVSTPAKMEKAFEQAAKYGWRVVPGSFVASRKPRARTQRRKARSTP